MIPPLDYHLFPIILITVLFSVDRSPFPFYKQSLLRVQCPILHCKESEAQLSVMGFLKKRNEFIGLSSRWDVMHWMLQSSLFMV